jgi:gliding motility-associated-like protein
MKNSILFYSFLLFGYFFQIILGWGQTPDCRQVFNVGRLVCGNASFATDNLIGAGLDDFSVVLLPNNDPGCLIRPFSNPGGGTISPTRTESYSAWYAFKIQTSGTLTFIITPNNLSNDFDFGVWGPNVTCNTLGTPIRCNFSGITGTTGLSNTGTSTSVGEAGTPFCTPMNVVAGELYYLMVNNFSENNSGFSLSWGGTAQLSVVNALFGSPSISCNKVSFINTSATCDQTATLSYMWNFGDGSPITANNSVASPTHTYTTAGTYNVTLKATVVSNNANNGKTMTYTKPVTISTVPQVPIFSGLSDQYCINTQPFNLSATPTGGTFTINGTSATQFNPSTLGTGTHLVKYTFTDANGCVGINTQNVTINPLPVLSFVDLKDNYCISNPAFLLQANPTGGIFKINNVVVTQLNPALLGLGNAEIRYEYNAGNGCTNSINKNIIINSKPSLAFLNLQNSYFDDQSAFILQATPTGGIFQINNVIATEFNPATLGIGTHLIKYTYIDPTNAGCSNEITQNVEIITNFTSTKETLKICPPELGYELMAMTFAEEIALINAGKKVSYKWNNGETTRSFFIKNKDQEDTYMVEVGEIGKPFLIKTFDVFINCEPKLILPTAFTPNGDGLNDNFEIKGGDFAFLNFQIYNRWGEIVFVSRGKDDNWDGTFMGKPCPEGVYVWQAKYENILRKDEKTEAKGQVTLVR